MNIFLAILASIAALIAPHFVLFIILSFCARKHNVTAKTLINRCSDVKDLFSLILALQMIISVVLVMSIALAFFVDHNEISTLLDALLAFAMYMPLLEFFFGIPFLIDDCTDAIREAVKGLHNQPIKF